MSTSLESRHFFMTGDAVQRVDGVQGVVQEGMALWAVVRWEDGAVQEVDQLDPAIEVIRRGGEDADG